MRAILELLAAGLFLCLLAWAGVEYVRYVTAVLP